MVPDVTVQGSKIKINLLLLKPGVDPNQKAYPSDQVKMAIEVKNNAVGGKTLPNGKQEDPNKVLRFKFNELEAMAYVKNFAVIVFSEMLLPPKPYKWRFKEEVIRKQNCKVFTFVARQLHPPGGLYVKSNIEGNAPEGSNEENRRIRKDDSLPKMPIAPTSSPVDYPKTVQQHIRRLLVKWHRAFIIIN